MTEETGDRVVGPIIREAPYRAPGLGPVSGEAIRYLAVQIAAYAVEIGTFWLCFAVDPRLIAVGNIAGKVNAGLFAFIAHRRVTFRGSKKRSVGSQACLYGLSLGANSLLGTALLLVLVRAGFAETVSKILADCGLIGLTFLVSRYVIFAKPPARQEPSPGALSDPAKSP